MKNLCLYLIFIGITTSCIVPPEKKKKDCPSTSQLSMITTNGTLSPDQLKVDSNVCEEVTLYKCDARVYSPDVQTSRSEEDYCFSDDNSQCIFIDTMSFSTSDQKLSDKFATEDDFKIGGQYNYSEVICYHIDLLKDGKSLATGDGSSVEEAIQNAIKTCKGLK
jgi:hypothetical protein